jgi:hypothetical protein
VVIGLWFDQSDTLGKTIIELINTVSKVLQSPLYSAGQWAQWILLVPLCNPLA